jgi:hypothetical protein
VLLRGFYFEESFDLDDFEQLVHQSLCGRHQKDFGWRVLKTGPGFAQKVQGTAVGVLHFGEVQGYLCGVG